MQTAQWLVLAAKVWGVCGLVTAVAFLVGGIDRVDPGARGVHAFRPLLLPGLILLWPLVLARWRAKLRAR